jgi:toxin ParE1/3/4
VTSPRVIISKDALNDLDEIERYIADHDSVGRALSVRQRLEAAMRNLAFIPGIGGHRPHLDADARSFPVRPWVIVYARLPESAGIRVVRVVDGRRDLPKLLGKNKKSP